MTRLIRDGNHFIRIFMGIFMGGEEYAWVLIDGPWFRALECAVSSAGSPLVTVVQYPPPAYDKIQPCAMRYAHARARVYHVWCRTRWTPEMGPVARKRGHARGYAGWTMGDRIPLTFNDLSWPQIEKGWR